MTILGRKIASKDQVMDVGSGVGVPRLAATIYGPVDVDSWVTAFGGLVGTRGTPGQDLTIGAFTVDDVGLPDRWLGEAAFTTNMEMDDQVAGDPWTPEYASAALAFWHKADAIVQSDNTAVASWTDSSGNGRSAANATGTEQPTFQTNELNGLPCVRFDGVDNDLTITGHGLSKPCTIFHVVKVNAAGSATFDLIFDGGVNLRNYIHEAPDDYTMTGGVALQYSTAALDANAHIHSLLFAASGNSTAAYDGTETTGDGGTGAPSANMIYGSNGASAHIAMDLFEIIGFAGALSADDRRRMEGYLAHKWGLGANLPADHPYKSAAPLATVPIQLRQSVVGTELPNQGIPLEAGSSVALYCFSTEAVAVSYHADEQYSALTIDDITSLPDPFGDHEVIAGRALDLYCELVANNATPLVNATALVDDLSNGSHALTPFANPSGHPAIWGGEPAINHSRFDLIDEPNGDELSTVHLQVATAPDVGSMVWERTLTKGELYGILQPATDATTYDLIASYIGPKLPPGSYFMRAQFADHFGALSDWTPWLDQGGDAAKAAWVDRLTFYLVANPGTAPIDRISTTNPADFRAIYDVTSTVPATHAHLLVSAVESDVVNQVALSEVVPVVADPGDTIVVPWDGGWDDLTPGTDYAYRLRPIHQFVWTPEIQNGVVLWLDGDTLSGVDGSAVAAWPDRLDDTLVATQGTAGNRPTLQLNEQNGRNVVRFDGSNDYLELASTLGITSQPFAQFAVWKPSALGQALMIWNNNTGLLVTDFDDDVGIFSGSAIFDTDHHVFGQWHVVSGVHNGASSGITVDGNAQTTGNAGSNAPSGSLYIGAGIAGIDRWLNGDLAELIVLKVAPTTVERQRIEGYLAWRWGLQASLPGSHPYASAAPGAIDNRWYVGNAPEWRRFRTNAQPTVPVELSPDSADGVGAFPLLVAVSSDADDTPATGFGARFRITRPDLSQVTVNAQLRAGTADTWERQTTVSEITAFGAYTWDAQAFDSGFTTAFSDPATFIYGELPVVTITEPDPAEVISGATLGVTWTSDSPQTAYQVVVVDPVTEGVVYDSGLIASAALLHNVPTSGLLHDHDYTVDVASTDDIGLVGHDDVTFHMLFALPATPTGFTANPLALSGDIEPTVVQLAWDETAEADFVAYRVTRQTAQQGDDGTDEITLATITDVDTITFSDPFPASDVSYTYRLSVVGERGLSEVVSLPASDTATIALSTVVLTGVGFGTELRVPLRYLSANDVEYTTDETFILPWSDSKPVSYEGSANYRVINARFALVTDSVEQAVDALRVLRQLNGSLPGSTTRPIVCYRDDRGRKLFGTMRLREQDQEIEWYEASLVITETNYREGEA